MSDVRQAITGILAALVSAVIIFGSIILALTETGQQVARLPDTNPTLPTSMPPIDTPEPGEATFTAAPTRMPQTPAVKPTSRCALRPGWQPIVVLPGDTLVTLAQDYGTSPEILIEGNCLESDDLMIGMEINIPPRKSTPSITPADTATATASATATGQAPPAKPKSGQSKPKATTCGPPSYWVRYTVRSGDNLTRIALATGTTVAQLRNANCLPSTLIRTGQRLWVPRLPLFKTPTPRPTRTPTLTRTSAPPTTAPTSTAVPTDIPDPTNTERPTDPPPPPSNTPLPTEPPPPTAYP